MTISAEEAQALVLGRIDTLKSNANADKFAIQSCELSSRGDYWVVRANSEDYVLRGMKEKCYVGASAQLVSVATGKIETVGSGLTCLLYFQEIQKAI